MSRTKPHDEFLELCAGSTSGQLNAAERKKLEEHLAVCSSCREALKQYQAVIDQVIPALAPEEMAQNIDPGPGWSQDRSEQLLFRAHCTRRQARTTTAWRRRSARKLCRARPPSSVSILQPSPMASPLGPVCGSHFAIGRARARRVSDWHKASREHDQVSAPAINGLDPSSLEEQLSDASHERELVRAQLASATRRS